MTATPRHIGRPGIRAIQALGLAAVLAPFTNGIALGAVVEPQIGTVGTEAAAYAEYGSDSLKLLSSSGTPSFIHDDVDSFFSPSYSQVMSTTSGATIYFPPDSFLTSVTTHSTGVGSADLARGELHFLGAANILTFNNQSSNAGVGILAGISDIITITGPILGTVDVRLTLTGSGSVKATAPFYNLSTFPSDSENEISFLSLAAQSELGPSSASVSIDNFNGNTVSFTNYVGNVGGGGTTESGDNANALRFSVYDDVMVSDQARTIEFVAQGYAGPHPDSNGGIVADFADTADLSILLPPGLGFMSASGILLTEPQTEPGNPGTDVPEPSTLMLLVTAFVAYIIVRSSHRRYPPAQA